MLTPTVALLALVAAGFAYWHRQWLTPGTVAALIAGAGLSAGWFAGLTSTLADWLGAGGDAATRAVAGTTVSGLPALIAAAWVAVDLYSKKPTRGTVVVALLVVPLAASVPGDVGQAVRDFLATLKG